MTHAVLAAENIHKSYGSVQALDDARIALRAGEIHAVMGENGSGKSTLLSILAGAQAADVGRILLAGVAQPGLTPRLARSCGIALVPQEPQLAAALSVGENIMLGRLPSRRGFVAWRRMHIEAQRVLDLLGIALPSQAMLGGLSSGRRQMVEIAKALVDTPRILLLDEATSSLDEADVAMLFALLRRLAAKGVAIGFVSHRMAEVMALADRATILRDGRHVGSVMIAETDEHRLVAMMVGRNLDNYWHKAKLSPGAPALEIAGLSRGMLRDISLVVHRHEIVGLAGLVGSGRSALLRTLVGDKPATQGQIAIAGVATRIDTPGIAHSLGISYVPEDRKSQGLVMDWSILRNAALAVMNTRAALAILRRAFDVAALARGAAGLNIKSAGPDQQLRALSGGNQQKILLARELATGPAILLLDEPTRGIDVGAKEDIYTKLATLVTAGLGVLLVSSELPELLGLCDRIYVLFRGRIVAEFSAADATEEAITYWASGAHELAVAS